MGRISCPDFIDRVAESRALDRTLDQAKAGTAPTLFVGGEAGIGKSRLVAEFVRRAAARDATVLTGGCVPFGGSPLPFMPVVEALRGFLRAAAGAERDRLAGAAPALGWVLPELGERSGSWRRPEGFEAGQAAMFGGLLAALEAIAADGPLVLVLEDLHWADRSTLDLLVLRTKMRRVPRGAVIGTHRSDELGPGHPLRLLFAELHRTGRAERLELRRFGRAELVAQMTGILGARPQHEQVEDVLGRSDGNPFLAEELLAGGGEAGAGAPTGVRDIVLARVETLTEPVQRVLGVVSAARRALPHQALVAVSGMDERDAEASLHEALGRHVLIRREGGRYAFRHELTREAIYDRLLTGERERLHLELARVLEARRATGGGDTAELLAECAHHWYSAGDRPRALRSAVQAGLAADGIHAHAEALTQYERGLELWVAVDAPERLAGMDRVAVRARAAEAASCVGEPLRATNLISQALQELDPLIEPVRAGLLRERLGRYSWIAGDTTGALAAYEDAVGTIPDATASSERARAVAALAHAQLISNRYRIARALAANGLELARAAGAPVEEGRALATLGAATASLGGGATGVQMIRDGRALLERAGAAPDFVFVTYAYEASALADRGEFEAALETLRPGIELMRRHGMHRAHQSWLEGERAASLVKLGRWTEASATLDGALLRGPLGITRRLLELVRAELALARGDLDLVAACLADARKAARGDQPFTGRLFDVASGAAAASGDFDSARASIADGLAALETLDDTRATAVLYRRGLAVEAERARDARSRGRMADGESAVALAGELVERLRALANRQGARSFAEVPVLLLSGEAELARAAGRPAFDLWLAAAAGWEALNEPYPRAVCLVHGAEAGFTERRSKARVTAWLGAAREIADELAARPLLESADSIAQRARVTLPAHGAHPPASPRRAPYGLTPREVEVLRLVTQGRTNRQIAETLFISHKTAAAHVSNILSKLEVDRRAEAAAVAARLDLVDTHHSG